MGNRVSASIVIGGQAPAELVDALCQAIEDERLGPDWGDSFETRDELVAYLRAGIDGVDLYGTEVNAGEFETLQAFCVEHGLAYRLTYDGYGGEWGPATRLHHADGTEETCSLDRDGGDACVCRDDLARLGFASIRELRAYLERFDCFRPGPLVIAEAASASD
ncbi:hypothetical protein [Phenylobacterium sp. SCN 70-31]|uniref:hypothetical protein n=1 Tax=Phenylobacterium sp. SCN 70-31 TaxID=1660129 RepID=UPI00086F98F0|nr:hypothetical protein [Phenylobacterium sp. SCN 70-31]ODT83577.1 MAG: hypothetical protein ABS78_23140 [Phenylobacterium sp. SCN 70-31]